MNKLAIIFIILIISFIFLFFIKNDSLFFASNKIKNLEIIKIAVCPTYHETAMRLDNNKYKIILTNSTAESIQLLQRKEVDLIISGRTLKPNEPQSESLIIEKGYSFLSNQEKTILEIDFENYYFYTDLDPEEIKGSFSIKNIEKVDNVYNYLNNGIVITSWENTNYHKAEIVHVFENNGKRLKPSRQPMIHCPNFCRQEFKEILASLR